MSPPFPTRYPLLQFSHRWHASTIHVVTLCWTWPPRPSVRRSPHINSVCLQSAVSPFPLKFPRYQRVSIWFFLEFELESSFLLLIKAQSCFECSNYSSHHLWALVNVNRKHNGLQPELSLFFLSIYIQTLVTVFQFNSLYGATLLNGCNFLVVIFLLEFSWKDTCNLSLIEGKIGILLKRKSSVYSQICSLLIYCQNCTEPIVVPGCGMEGWRDEDMKGVVDLR